MYIRRVRRSLELFSFELKDNYEDFYFPTKSKISVLCILSVYICTKVTEYS